MDPVIQVILEQLKELSTHQDKLVVALKQTHKQQPRTQTGHKCWPKKIKK
jgi:hypothetical protein